MGCLNSEGQFSHWFGNIHLSGPCNRSCYFCIGQHMMQLDKYNNLKKWPLDNIDKFVEKCKEKGVKEVNLTGTNTDPLLYAHTPELVLYLKEHLGDDAVIGVRTNGAQVLPNLERWRLFDKASVTICSFDLDIYQKMMGKGMPPQLNKILEHSTHMRDVKINIVLGPENVGMDLLNTLTDCALSGIQRVNIREPYGQPHVGDPFLNARVPVEFTKGMPTYDFAGMKVTYWDVHYCEVESVNLYANGIVSETYPITKGHHPTGEVKDQSNFPGGRIRDQWQYGTPT